MEKYCKAQREFEELKKGKRILKKAVSFFTKEID